MGESEFMDTRKTLMMIVLLFSTVYASGITAEWVKTKDSYIMSCIDLEPTGIMGFVEWKVTNIDYKCLSNYLQLEYIGDIKTISSDETYVRSIVKDKAVPIVVGAESIEIDYNDFLDKKSVVTYATSYDKVKFGVATEEWELTYNLFSYFGYCDDNGVRVYSDYHNCTSGTSVKNSSITTIYHYLNETDNSTTWKFNYTFYYHLYPVLNDTPVQMWTEIQQDAIITDEFTADCYSVNYTQGLNGTGLLNESFLSEGLFTTALFNSSDDAGGFPDDWWDEDWSMRMIVNVSSTYNLTDYPVKLSIDYNESWQADFDDLRFTDMDGNLLEYWIENKTDGVNATVWIKGNWTDIDISQMYLYCDNPSAESLSNGTNTFTFFDDFLGSSISDAWSEETGAVTVSDGTATITNSEAFKSVATYGLNYTLGVRAYSNEQDWTYGFGNADTFGYSSDGVSIINSDGEDDGNFTMIGYRAYDTSSDTVYLPSIDTRAYFTTEISRNSSATAKYSINGISQYNKSVEIPSTALSIYFYEYGQPSSTVIDYVYIRKSVPIEPILTLTSCCDTPEGCGSEYGINLDMTWVTGYLHCSDHSDCHEDYFCVPYYEGLGLIYATQVCQADLSTDVELMLNTHYPEGTQTFYANYTYQNAPIPNGSGVFTIAYRNGTFIENISATWNPLIDMYEGTTSLNTSEIDVNVSIQAQPYYSIAYDTGETDIVYMSLTIEYPEEFELLRSKTIYPKINLILSDFYDTGTCRLRINTETTGWFTVVNNVSYDNFPINLINDENYLVVDCIMGDIILTKAVGFTTSAVPDPYLLGINLNAHLITQEGLHDYKAFLNVFGKGWFFFILPTSFIILIAYAFIKALNKGFNPKGDGSRVK